MPGISREKLNLSDELLEFTFPNLRRQQKKHYSN